MLHLSSIHIDIVKQQNTIFTHIPQTHFPQKLVIENYGACPKWER